MLSCFSLTKGLYVRNVRLHFPYRQYTNFSYIDLYFNTILPAQHTTFISVAQLVGALVYRDPDLDIAYARSQRFEVAFFATGPG